MDRWREKEGGGRRRKGGGRRREGGGDQGGKTEREGKLH